MPFQLSRTKILVLLVSPLLGACLSGPEQDQVEPATETAPAFGPWDLPPAPPAGEYDGPLFALSHDYPDGVAPPDPSPWQQAIGGGRITSSSAGAYTQALKDCIADDMQTLLFDYGNWNATEARWYNQPWLSEIRDPIRGSYVGSQFPAAMFSQSGLMAPITTYVAVYYNAVAAGSLATVWGSEGMDPIPGLVAGGAQFPEGSIIVKPAFVTASAEQWPPMEGAYSVGVWASTNASAQIPPPSVLQTVSLFQFDIIVKDSIAAPDTTWVFATLVYDSTAEGDNWAKMVPLGAMWGNDPDVVSPEGCQASNNCPPLVETWINPDAPVYSKETLGWGGRLSGPNDGAVDIAAAVQTESGIQAYTASGGRYAMSSCMSCHSSAEYEMESFLLPSPSECANDACGPTFAICDDQGNCTPASGRAQGARLVYHDAGTDEFRRWFQSRPGDVPTDPGTIALDYAMNYAFKALPAWYKATGQTGAGPTLNFVERFNNYRGRLVEAH